MTARGKGTGHCVSGLVLPYRNFVPELAPDVFLAPGATVIGNVVIGAGSSIWFNAVVRGDVNEIRIGERSNLQDGTIVHVTSDGLGTYVGNDITVGHRAILHACTLQDGCLVGMGATVMDGVVVESGGMVAAGALVTFNKRVKSGELWGGSPARCMRKVNDEEFAQIAASAKVYARLAQEYRTALSSSAP
jgi:carbonic anhydrase/acetyltransferase-like protein (isoleucine patch superfamily)